jgi:hypothetical protein
MRHSFFTVLLILAAPHHGLAFRSMDEAVQEKPPFSLSQVKAGESDKAINNENGTATYYAPLLSRKGKSAEKIWINNEKGGVVFKDGSSLSPISNDGTTLLINGVKADLANPQHRAVYQEIGELVMERYLNDPNAQRWFKSIYKIELGDAASADVGLNSSQQSVPSLKERLAHIAPVKKGFRPAVTSMSRAEAIRSYLANSEKWVAGTCGSDGTCFYRDGQGTELRLTEDDKKGLELLMGKAETGAPSTTEKSSAQFDARFIKGAEPSAIFTEIEKRLKEKGTTSGTVSVYVGMQDCEPCRNGLAYYRKQSDLSKVPDFLDFAPSAVKPGLLTLTTPVGGLYYIPKVLTFKVNSDGTLDKKPVSEVAPPK